MVKYPEIRIKVEATHFKSTKDAKYVQMLGNVFERFDAICRFNTVSQKLKFFENISDNFHQFSFF